MATGGQPTVYGAIYSGIPVYEMNCRQVAVMRRKDDSFLNATQILKVAGVEKGRRTKILEREVQIGRHEKVQGGYGKYQGTWIPFERGVEIARQYGVDELLRSLFEYTPSPDDELDTPKKIKRPASVKTKSSSNIEDNNPAIKNSLVYGKKNIESQNGNNNNFGYYVPVHGSSSIPTSTMPPLSSHASSSFYHASGVVPPPNTSLHSNNVQQQISNGEKYRAILMSVFLNHESYKVPDLLTNPNPPVDLDIDLIIDDQGHTSLHWASALARINILQYLLSLKADPRRVNFNGESALIRSVLVTNNFDNDTFYDLLLLLAPCIDVVDKKGRTIFHHIALTAGIKGRIQASRYYLGTLLMVMKKLNLNISCIIDQKDKNGDTALNIASRISNRSLVEQLLRAGANPEIPNRAGLRPLDFGLEDSKLAELFQGGHEFFDSDGSGITPDYTEINMSEGSLHSELKQKTALLNKSNVQIATLAKTLARTRHAMNTLSTQVAYLSQRLQSYEPISQMNSSSHYLNESLFENKESYLQAQIIKLQSIINAHEIDIGNDKDLYMDKTLLPPSDFVGNTSEKVNQLVANILDLPVEQLNTLVDPLLVAVASEKNLDSAMEL
jgi:regulatory protein SWI6